MKTKQEDDEEYSTPQIFVNELLKLYNQRHITLETLDDQIATMIVGVIILERQFCDEFVSENVQVFCFRVMKRQR